MTNTAIFRTTMWNSKPPEVAALKGGRVRVARNLSQVTTEDGTFWHGESAIMTADAYAAYEGARQVALKREQEIADETILALIEEGSI